MNRTNMIKLRVLELDRLAGEEFELHPRHYNLLQHSEGGGIVAGWEKWGDDVLLDLEAWGFMQGEWVGSVRYEAHPYWSITKEGRDALRDRPR